METKKITAKEAVAALGDTVKSMTVAELTAAGKNAGFDSRAGFTAWKKALLSVGVDYNALRDARREEKTEQLQTACKHQITLFSDAKASHSRFAICDKNGNVVWYGRFFDDDADFDGEQSSGEMAAAKKAVWLAHKVAESLGEQAIALTLMIDAEWLTWANATDGKGGKAKQLAELARRYNVALTVEHINGSSNPADSWTISSGFKKWSDNNLAALVA